jgi:hypothetical protein
LHPLQFLTLAPPFRRGLVSVLAQQFAKSPLWVISGHAAKGQCSRGCERFGSDRDMEDSLMSKNSRVFIKKPTCRPATLSHGPALSATIFKVFCVINPVCAACDRECESYRQRCDERCGRSKTEKWDDPLLGHRSLRLIVAFWMAHLKRRKTRNF